MATINYNGMELEEFNPDKSVSFNPPIKCVGWNNKDVKIEFELSAALCKDIWLHRFIGKSKDDNPVAFMFCAMLKEKPAPRRDAWIEYNKYPLHPGQTHAQPLYAQIPLEEYESIMRENKRLKDVLKRHGITLLKED